MQIDHNSSQQSAKFNARASQLMLDRRAVGNFLQSLGVSSEWTKGGYKISCPQCRRKINITRGKQLPLVWVCYNRDCSANSYVHNLLGLTRLLSVNKSMTAAFHTISTFLGFDHPYEITNLPEKGPSVPVVKS